MTARAQPNHSRRYPSTHITFVYLSHIEPVISYMRLSPFSMVRQGYLKPTLHIVDPLENLYTLDFLAFSLIIFSAMKSRVPGVKIPSILEVITRDAMRYFLVIFTGHFVLAMTLAFAQVSDCSPRWATVNVIPTFSPGTGTIFSGAVSYHQLSLNTIPSS